MKIQDIIFLIILLSLFLKRKPHYFVLVGIISLVFSVPLFSAWIFFTAQRLVYYAGAFLLIGIILMFFRESRKGQ